MKAKLKRHSRSALSVLLSLCMLVSCITVGMIGTDAAQTLDAIGASLDEASAGAKADEASVGAALDESDEESVGADTATIKYDWNGSWATQTLTKDEAWEVTFSSSKTINFLFQKGSTWYKYHSSQQQPYDSTSQNTFKAHSGGSSDLSFTVKAATYVIIYTGQSNEILNFKFYRKQTTYSITKNTDGHGTLSGASSAEKDASVTLTANPNRGYQFNAAGTTVKDADGNNVSFTTSGNNITFTMPAKAVTATAAFSTATSRTVTASQVTVEQGTIKLTLKSGSSVVASASADNNLGATLTAYDGETLTVSTSPSAGYKLKKITINGTDYTSAHTITISGSNVTVSAEFEKGAALPNDYTATLGSTITSNSNLFSNIKATFFDYYTDHEVSGSWYTSIVAADDAWVKGTSGDQIGTRNPYTTLNSALSEYAKEKDIKYPMYFGSFYPGSYDDPNYYHSAKDSPYYGNKINDSNGIGDNHNALPGLAGSSLSGGMISYSNGTNGGNGAEMVLFDKNWLSSRGDGTESSDTITLKYRDTNWTETNDWSYNSCRVCAAFRTSSDIYFVEMTKNATDHVFTCSIPSGYNETTNTLYFVRFESGKTPPTDGSYASNYTWPSHNDEASIAYNKNSHTYRTKSWNSVELIYNGPLASFVNSAFPVRKTTHDNATYYEFDSTNATDNIYFDGLTGGSPVLQYGASSTYGQKAGYNHTYGFFPFDKYTEKKRSEDWSKAYGKDLALGMKLEIKFTLGKNASGNIGYILKDGCDGSSDSHYTAQKFDFSGDDDLWVYVDDNLLLDLGGDHKQSTGTINFATRKIQKTSSDTSAVAADTTLTSAQGITRNSTTTQFTLADKKVHTMTIYYMERGMHESNLKFGFSMSPLANEFSTEKELSTTGLNSGLASQFSDTFEITDTSGHLINKAYTYYKWNGSAYVEQSGSYSSNANGKFNLTSNPTKQYADFDNKLTVGDILQVTEDSQKGYHYTSTYQVLDQEYLVDGEPDLIKGGSGADTGQFTFKTALPNADPNTDVTNLRVKFNNTLKTQTLDITKAIQDGYESPDRFTIQLGLVMKKNGTTTQTFNAVGLKYKSSEDGFVEEHTLGSSGQTNIGQTTIGRGEVIRFEGIPEGAVATVTELDKTGFAFVSMTHSETGNTFTTATKSATVTLNKYDKITITNEKLHDLTISKTVTGGASSAYFPVVVKKYSGGSYVQITSSNYNTYSYSTSPVPTSSGGDWYFNTSTNRFMVKAGKSFTIKGSSTGDKFTVAEYTGDISGYTYTRTDVTPLSAVDVDDDVVADSTNKLYGYENITFATDDINVNISNAVYVPPTYNLTVTKTVTGGDSTEYFPIYVQYKYAGGSSYEPLVDGNVSSFITETIPTSRTGNPDWYFDEDNKRFMLKAGESFTLSACNNGDQFIVAEDTGNISGYTYTNTTASNGTGTGYTSGNRKGLQNITIADSDVTVTVTNAKDTGKNLKIYKKLTTGSSTLSYTMFIKAGSGAYSGTYKICNASDDQVVNSGTYDSSTGIEIETSQYILLERIPSGTEIEVTEADYTSSARAYHYAYSMFGSGSGSLSEVTATEGSPKKVDNGIDFTLTNDSVVEVYNKPWGYQIEYAYPGYLKRYGVGGTDNQLYSLSGTFTDQDFTSGIVEAAEVKDDSHDGDLVDGVRFVSAEKESTFITSRAPYQDNFMTLIIWNPVFDDPGSNTHTYFYSGNEAQEIKITIDATVQSQLNCNVYFKLPFDYTISDAGLVPTKSESDGNKIIKVDNKTVNLETQYGKWYTLNNVHTLDDPRGEPQFVEAPGEIYQKNGDGSYTKYVFRYWQMTSVGKEYTGDKRRHALKEAYEYKRCYNSKFNMTFYQDSYVEPIYVVAGSPDDDGKSPSELETLDTAGGMSMINFLENSRNQWNNGGGRNQEFSSRVNEGDRIYCDFLLSFGYNDIALQSSLGKYKTETLTDENGDEYERKTFCPIYYNSDEIHYTGGFVLERVAEMADENDDGAIDEKDILTQAQYISKYGEDTSAATAYIRNGTNTSSGDPRFILNETFSMAAVDNKNQFEYSTSIPNKNDGTGRPYKKYIYRAYTYMRDYNAPADGIGHYSCEVYGGTIPESLYNGITGHNGELIASTVSKPVYFTIYEMASIENGTTYTGGGQS